ncbi:MAG: MerR family DNA-binding transcriptional regulator [Boseongicola sp.]|nr:MerR family DNA-binding transcriptional regulator [Boseongicola sp.]MDD9977306.1 MerR family DNA-binding transcriptional regulator [Boseongicola sp.]
MSTDTMTIREMCDAYGVTPRTLRFYEAKELLFPIRQGSRRLFTRSDRARLKLILRGKRFGFSLEDIRQLLDLYNPQSQNLAQMKRAFVLGQERLNDMIRQRDELNIAIDDLRQQLEWGESHITDLTNPQKTAAE